MDAEGKAQRAVVHDGRDYASVAVDYRRDQQQRQSADGLNAGRPEYDGQAAAKDRERREKMARDVANNEQARNERIM